MASCYGFYMASKVMHFAEDLKRSAVELEVRATSRAERQVQRYRQKCAKKLSDAACSPDPVDAVSKLGQKYAGESEKGGKKAEIAATLSHACDAVVNGEDPSSSH
jgi:hypothetical protein